MPRDREKSRYRDKRSTSRSSESSYERKKNKNKHRRRSRSRDRSESSHKRKRSTSRSRYKRRSYSRSLSRDRYEGKSKKRSPSRTRSRRNRSPSRSSSRSRSKYNKSRNKSSKRSHSRSRSSSFDIEKPIRSKLVNLDDTDSKVEKAIKAAEAAGLTMTKIPTYAYREVDVKEDMPTIHDRNLLAELNSDTFIQKPFVTSRNNKESQSILIDLNSDTVKVGESDINVQKDDCIINFDKLKFTEIFEENLHEQDMEAKKAKGRVNNNDKVCGATDVKDIQTLDSEYYQKSQRNTKRGRLKRNVDKKTISI